MTAHIGVHRPPAGVSGTTKLAALLAASSAIELLVLRTFTRTAIHIPALEAMRKPYEIMAFGGRYAYFVSAALLLLVLPLLAWRLWQREETLSRVAATGVAVFALVAALAPAGLAGRYVLDAGTLAGIGVLGGVAAGRLGARGAIPVGLFGLAFLLSGGHTLAQSASNAGMASFDTSRLLVAAEYAGVAFALAMPLLLGRPSGRSATVAGVAMTVIGLAVFLGNGSTSRFLLLWNVGLSGVLPGVIYAVAGGTLAATFAGLLRAGRVPHATAVALLVAGGIGLHSTYQSALVIAALALLTLYSPSVPLDTSR